MKVKLLCVVAALAELACSSTVDKQAGTGGQSGSGGSLGVGGFGGFGGSGGSGGSGGFQPCAMSEPAPMAFSCTSDSTCLAHRCNIAAGKCAWPCTTDCDCAAGNKCASPACVAVASGCGQQKDDPGVMDLVSSKL